MKRRAVNKHKGVYFFVVVVFLACYFTPTLYGCGPFLPSAIFTYSLHPDIPLESYAKGEIGVVNPAYARSYLAVAYRYLNGNDLTPAEQQAVLRLWNDRLQNTYGNPEQQDYVAKWLEARKKVAKDEIQIDVAKSIDSPDRYISYINCNDDAFIAATETLNKKLAKGSATSAEVIEWLKAQDQVFTNCSAGPAMPAPLPPNSNPVLRAERNYQLASANFYSGKFDVAETLFNDIAKDKASPYSKIASYLAARAMIRKASINSDEKQTDKASYTKAETQLKAILNDKAQAELHPAAQRLINFIGIRLYPNKQIHQLAGEILKKNTNNSLEQNLRDYTFLLDKNADEEDYTDPPSVQDPIKSKAANLRGKDELTDWLIVFQSSDKPSVDYAIQQWEQTSSAAWLVAALTKVDAANPKTPALLIAAEKVAPNTAAYDSVAYHQNRLLLEFGKKDEARKNLDTILEKTSSLQPSTRNLFLAQRFKVSRNFDEFLKYAQRVPTGISYGEDGREMPSELSGFDEDPTAPKKEKEPLPVLFDKDSTEVMNEQLPLTMLKQAALNKSLPANLHRNLLIATWTRAILIDDEQTAKDLVPELAKAEPKLKELLDAYSKEQTPDGRKFAAIYLMLKAPGTRPEVEVNVLRETPVNEIDNFRDNWWCSYDPKDKVVPEGETPKPQPPKFKPDFLTEPQIKAAAAEQQKLYQLSSAPNYLCTQVVKFAKTNAQDPRVPEALHLAVRSTRFGCAASKAASKAAFQALHKGYPQSEWTKKTPYFFGE